MAIDLARGYSLAVVEGSLLPLAEWAAGAAATNLLTGQTTESKIPEDVRNDLDSAIFYGGRNGWTAPDEKAQARRYFDGHVQAGRLTPDQAAAYALASQSVSDRGAKRLRDLLSRSRDRGDSGYHSRSQTELGAALGESRRWGRASRQAGPSLSAALRLSSRCCSRAVPYRMDVATYASWKMLGAIGESSTQPLWLAV